MDVSLFAQGGGHLNNFLPLKHYHQHACSFLPTFACVASDPSSPPSLAPLTLFTLISWIAFLILLSRPCPAPVPLLASIVILVCFALAPTSLDHWQTLVWIEAPVTAVLLRGGDAKAIPAWPWIPLPPLLITRLLVQFYIASLSPLSHHAAMCCIVVFMAASALGSHKPFSNPLSCYWAGYELLLDSYPWLILFTKMLLRHLILQTGTRAGPLPSSPAVPPFSSTEVASRRLCCRFVILFSAIAFARVFALCDSFPGLDRESRTKLPEKWPTFLNWRVEVGASVLQMRWHTRLSSPASCYTALTSLCMVALAATRTPTNPTNSGSN